MPLTLFLQKVLSRKVSSVRSSALDISSLTAQQLFSVPRVYKITLVLMILLS